VTGLIVDLFAGGGGASEGIRLALGRCPDVAINHDEAAIAMHEANHPATRHLREDIRAVSPRDVTGGKPVDLLWASPDCKHFSRAKGSAPREKAIRSLAWVVVDWARDVRPNVIALENVPEFVTWGPLSEDGRVIGARAGETFREFVKADFGAPTARKRIFLIARCDGLPIVWPTPTHGQGLLPVRTAAECIDWTIPAPSIFARRKPLAENTLRRIAEGIRRYVIGTPTPFIVSQYGQSIGRSADAPLPTITAGGMGHQSLVVPTLVQTGYGEREGQAPRCLNIHAPLGTVVASVKHGLVEAFLERFQLGTFPGRSDQVAAFLTKFYGTSTGAQMDLPMPTVTATGHHLGIVTVRGEAYRIVDIGMRMLEPRELATAQGFRPDYILTGNKTQQVARIGNSVCPPVAAAVVRANTTALAGAA
jgi:DNA (cytosine-5)-methyltransferase 1